MLGPKQEKVRKPRALRLYCWIFSMGGVRRRAQCTRRSVDMQQFREISRLQLYKFPLYHTSNIPYSVCPQFYQYPLCHTGNIPYICLPMALQVLPLPCRYYALRVHEYPQLYKSPLCHKRPVQFPPCPSVTLHLLTQLQVSPLPYIYLTFMYPVQLFSLSYNNPTFMHPATSFPIVLQ